LASLGLTGLLALASQLTHVSFLPLNLADLAIRLTPGKIATFGIEALGPLAKMGVEAASIIGFIMIGAALGAVFGWWAARNRARPPVVAGEIFGVVIMLGLLGLQLSDPSAASLDSFTTILLGVLSLGWGAAVGSIFGRLQPSSLSPATAEEAGAIDPGRRVFLRRSAAAAVTLAVGSTALAELLRQSGEDAIAQAALPPAPRLPTPTPSLASFKIPAGVRPFITPIDKLYTVASRTRDPVVDPATYRLVIDGVVRRPLSLSLADLQQRPRIDQTSTLECISNEVGGGLIGNVSWNGTSLKALLDEAGLEPGVQRLVFHAAEGYVDSIPLDAAMLATTLVVYGADGQPLPRKHGFPVRIVVPSIYGMKNVKWLTRIEAIKTDFKGYWQERGWSNPAPVKTTAVTDTRGSLAVDQGIVPLGGIAFAGDRGISAVEVQIDGGDWQKASLADETSKVQWRLWRYDWPATPGKHRIAVRAVDGRGEPQSPQVTPPHPDGASGYHTVEVSI
jgi:DMSO/TMAO reductase YedYZ molybdopterin-dependent catalytic subunit